RALVRERLAHSIAKLPVDPTLNWHAETLLGSVEDLVRHEATHGLLEDALRLATAHLEIGWDRRDELDELVIEGRDTRFERDRHAHSVHLREDVAGQIGLTVEVEEPVERLGRARPARVLAEPIDDARAAS